MLKKTLKAIEEYLLNGTYPIEITSLESVELRKQRKRGFREIIKKDQRYKLVRSSFKGEKQVLARNWNWNQEKKKQKLDKKNRKKLSKSISPRRVSVIEDWYIIPKVWEAQEVIYNAYTKHGSHLKIDATYKEVLKSGFKWENIQWDIRDFYFKCQIWEARISKPRKKDIVKHIDTYAPKERYQADTINLSSYVSGDFKYIFTMVDHFTKYGWIVPLKDKKAENILIAFKKWVTTHNVPLSLQTDNGTEFKNSVLKEFCKQKKIKQIFGTPYNPQHQGAVEAFNRTVQDFLTMAKDHQREKYNIEECLSDFLIYYNDRVHSTTKVAPYVAMMNVGDKELLKKIRENTINRRKSAKILTEDYPEKSSVRISNFIRIVDDHHIRFNPPRGYMKSIKKENWFVLGKVIKSRRNYCKVKIIENQSEFDSLTKDSVWNIEKKALKKK